MSWRIFSGKRLHSASWRVTKSDIQKEADWYRQRGYLARVVPAREDLLSGKKGRKGYQLYVLGMQGRKSKGG